MTKGISLLFRLLPSFLLLISCIENKSVNLNQPVLGVRSIDILDADGYSFKDHNKNGKLDPYEDWRLSAEQRCENLLSQMTLEEKVGFMIISTTRLKNDWSFEKPQSSDPITSDFNEIDLVQENNMFTRQPLPYPMMNSAGTTKAVREFHLRHFILRANVSAVTIAEWSNKLQELCESTPLGIPSIVASNPRNHITVDAALGTSLGKTDFSVWPGELGLSAMRDLDLTREFADIARQEWAAVGLRKGYMYMADLATEPRWQRIDGTFGENAEWVSQMIREIILGFQGDSLHSGSVALTTKHFPGGGSGEAGHDPHFPWGKKAVYPGGMYDNNLLPFIAAIKSGTSSIMPYYSMPVGTENEEIAFAYNKGVLKDLLRNELGFEGIINSDTGPIEMMPWGVEDLSLTERYKKALEAGVNIFSGTADPYHLLETAKSDMVDLSLIDNSVKLLLIEKFKLGLFENPYVNEDMAEKTAGKKEFQQKADLALRKSIVLLRNENNALPLQPKSRIYFEMFQAGPTGGSEKRILSNLGKNTDLELVNHPDEADKIVIWVFPKGKSLFGSDGSALSLSLSKNGMDIPGMKQLISKKPCILILNYSNPWVIDELYNEETKANFQGVLATFGTTSDAVLDVLSGKFAPTGRMPFSTPISEEAVLRQKEDVPGYMEGENYALFHYDEGLEYGH